MEASVHFVLSVVLILVLTSSITVICWELPMELHSKNDARQRIYYPRTKREYQIKNNIYTNRQTESQIFLRGLKDSRHNYRFGHMLDAAFNGHFQSINNKRLVRQKRDSVFENHTSVFALLGGILFFVFLGGVALFCWWSKSCGVEKGDNGQVSFKSIIFLIFKVTVCSLTIILYPKVTSRKVNMALKSK